MAGRPPKPTKLHVLHGTLDKSRHGRRAGEPDVAAGPGDPPEWLGEYGKAEWTRIMSDAVYGNLIRANHRTSLEHYCVLYDRFVKDAIGQAPLSASERQTFHSLCMQFGFTPASQAKVAAPVAEKKKNDFAALG